MLQLLKNLRFHAQGKEITDADILNWANKKVKSAGRKSQVESFKVILKKKSFKPDISVSVSQYLSSLFCSVRTKVYQMGRSS